MAIILYRFLVLELYQLFLVFTTANETEEYDYASILNAVLPKDIRIVDVCRVGSHFDARYIFVN